MKQQKSKKCSAFTLVELLVVIAILAILATVTIVGYTAFLDRANKSNAATEAAEIEKVIKASLMADGQYVLATVKDSNSYVIQKTTTGTNDYYKVVILDKDGKVTETDAKDYVFANVAGTATDSKQIAANEDLKEVLGNKNTLAVATSKTETSQTNGVLTFTYVGSSASYTVEIDLNTAIGTNGEATEVKA